MEPVRHAAVVHHVIILEPQLDLATELQMIGRVHRIGQTRQTYVHRLCVDGSFERSLASERQARSVSAHQVEQGGEAVHGTRSLD